MAPEFSHGLSLQMSQRMDMVMTPQMIQSMEMLQLPLLALEQKINQELAENPALELADLGENPETPAETTGEEAPGDIDDYESEDLRRADEIDMDWDTWYEDTAPYRLSSGEDEERFDPVENAAAPALSFYDYLENQLKFFELTDRQKRLCERIIRNLEPSGYLAVPLAETVDPEETPPPAPEELTEALGTVQKLDPPGVGAANPRECLLLQLDVLSGDYRLEREIVDRHLEDLAANRLPQIAKALGSSLEAVKTAAAFIKTLNPHPGLDYGPDGIGRIQPDLVAEVDDAGEWEVRLIGGSQPDISDMFLALFDNTKRGKQLREKMLADPGRKAEFEEMRRLLGHGEQGKLLRDKYNSARWLVTAVAQRERTLLRVAQDIVAQQKAFLAGQANAPAPLMMQETADRVGIDISTVSRAVRDKYVDTPLGIKPLRMFYTRAVGAAAPGDDGKSNVAIMNRIREIIASEDKKRPLKDDQIQEVLAREGTEIKRRTVAKYRANLGYPNHSQRREY